LRTTEPEGDIRGRLKLALGWRTIDRIGMTAFMSFTSTWLNDPHSLAHTLIGSEAEAG
jgi:hypothetical protein